MSESVYLTRQLPQTVVDFLSQRYSVQSFSQEFTPVPYEKLLSQVPGSRGILSLLTDTIDERVLDAAGPTLKVIANMAVGFDNINVQAAKDRGIVVTNTPDILTETTADLVFALLLNVARRVSEGDRVLRAGDWKTWSPMFLTGLDVYGKTLGIVGMGRIGKAVARRATGFGMRILYHNRRRKEDVEISLGAHYTELMTLLSESDFVVVLVPLTNDTRKLIGQQELSAMKNTAIFINVARGPVVDEVALVEALTKKNIWAAGLDVFEQEPISGDNPLLKLDNVVLLPHIGSASVETRTAMAMLAAKNIDAVLRGEAPLTPV